MGVSLDMKGVKGLLEKEKINVVDSWPVAESELRTKGYVDISTGGGRDWNLQVAERLSKDFGKKVLFAGPSPGYNEDGGVYRYTAIADNNKQAALLLSKEY
jgi:hypothetical protein